jgi:hypothetical protein
MLEILRLTGVKKESLAVQLSSFNNFAALDARSANPNMLGAAGDNCPNFFQIDIPATLGDVVCVTDFVTELRSATACFTNSCHKTEISLEL